MIPNVLIAGCDRPLYYTRIDVDDSTVQPTIESVSGVLNGAAVTIADTPQWDEENARYALEALGTEIAAAGTLLLTWKGTDPDGRAFTDTETVIVLADDSPDALLLRRVQEFLRLEDNDPTVWMLVGAAKAYVAGAGVTRPDPAEDEEKTAQYDLAVSLYVSIIFSGGESKLDAAMTAVLLQLR